MGVSAGNSPCCVDRCEAAGSYNRSSPGSVEVVLSVESARDDLRNSRSPRALLFTIGTTTVVVDSASESVDVVVSWRDRESGEPPPELLAILSKKISRCNEGSLGSPRDNRVCWKSGIRLELATARRLSASCTLDWTLVSEFILDRVSLDDLCTCDHQNNKHWSDFNLQ